MRHEGKTGITVSWVIVGVAVVAALGVGALLLRGGFKSRPPEVGLTFTVARGPLTISVTESGTVKSRQQEIIKSELEGQSTILFLIPEGTRVKKGELLVELDASRQQDQRIDKQIAVQNAEANFISAREKLEVTKNQAQADVSKAELDAKFAVDDHKKYLDGDFPMDKKTAESKIALAGEDLQRANDKAEWSRKLFNEKYISETELRADELAAKKSKFDVELAQQALELLKDYTFARRVEELKSNVEQTALTLERVKRKAAADIVQAEADLKAKDSEFDRQKSQLTKLDQQIAKAKMTAPTDGMAVYATTGSGGSRYGSSEPLAEGATVRERQQLIYLPTATDMMAEVKVHESSLNKVRVGLTAQVTVDAVPGQVFTGRVAKIAPLPDAQSAYLNPDLKVYTTEITLDGDGSALRTGMNCRAEIVVSQYPDATYVPVQSVVRVKSQPMVYVVEQGKAQPKVIELGMDNNRMAHIKSGLQAGQLVLLSPPLADAEKIGSEPTGPGGNDKAAASDSGAAPRPGPEVAGDDAAPGAGAPNVSPGEKRPPGRGGKGMKMSDADREKMQQRLQNMTPEERDKLAKQWGKSPEPAANP